MSWITITWPMVAGGCLLLGLLELRVALAQSPRGARLLFALSAFAVAAFSGVELALMHADTVAQAAVLLHIIDVGVGLVLALLTGFVWVYFGTGNKWLALSVPGIYVVALLPDLLPGGADMTYLRITGLRAVETFGGATFNVLEGVPNPWDSIAYLAAAAMVVFVVDASVRLWRRGGRRRAVVVGGGVILFLFIGGVHTAMVDAGIVRTPYMFSWAYLCVLLAMGHELSTDVFAAEQIARELHDSERAMDLAADAAGLGMWTWDVIRDRIWATPKARAFFGFSETESLNLARFNGALHAADRDAVGQAIERALSAGGGYELEYRVRLPDGATRWIAARGQCERDAGGKTVLMRGVLLDTSARHRFELELDELRGQLAHVGRVSMMGQLASALAHELSQPLGAILRNAEAAELFLQHDQPDLDELRAILVDIRMDDQRAGDVIERLRALLKRRSLEARALAVSDLLAHCEALTRADAIARHVVLEFEVAPGQPTVMGDQVHLQQVLLNLLVNAMDGVEEAPAEQQRVVVRAHRNDTGAVEVSVSDRGRGIPPDQLELVFDPFFTTKENGMGMGLAISRTIIEAHGGRIWAENNADCGATFRFTLPVAEAPIS